MESIESRLRTEISNTFMGRRMATDDLPYRAVNDVVTPEMVRAQAREFIAREREAGRLVARHGPLCFVGLSEGHACVRVRLDPRDLPMEAAEYEEAVGGPPVLDALERVNCDTVGGPGHWLCGWCEEHWTPRAMCGCQAMELLHG